MVLNFQILNLTSFNQSTGTNYLLVKVNQNQLGSNLSSGDF
jgi:hypothetical protein